MVSIIYGQKICIGDMRMNKWYWKFITFKPWRFLFFKLDRIEHDNNNHTRFIYTPRRFKKPLT